MMLWVLKIVIELEILQEFCTYEVKYCLFNVMPIVLLFLCVSVPLECQWALPVPGQHCLCLEAVLQPEEQDSSFHVSMRSIFCALSKTKKLFGLSFLCLHMQNN